MSKRNKQNPIPETAPSSTPNMASLAPEQQWIHTEPQVDPYLRVGAIPPQEATDPELLSECQPCPWTKAKGKSIFEFQQDDIVIYVLPKTTVTYESDRIFYSFGSVRREEPDNTFHRPFRLLGIRNNIIYLHQINKGGTGPIVNASLNTMENGWELFEIPANLTMDDVCGTPHS